MVGLRAEHGNAGAADGRRRQQACDQPPSIRRATKARELRFLWFVPLILTLIPAVKRSVTHGAKPTSRKMTKFGETLDLLKSASAWDKFSLNRFGVHFEKAAYMELNHIIPSSKWYDVLEEPTKGFKARTIDYTEFS